MKLIFKVINGEINLENLKTKLKTLKDGNYEMNIKKSRTIRSINQNNYYHGVVVKELYEYFQRVVTVAQIHDILKYKFLANRFENPVTGEIVEQIGTTTKLNTKQMEEYLEQCRKYALEEYNHRIPLPNETEYNY